MDHLVCHHYAQQNKKGTATKNAMHHGLVQGGHKGVRSCATGPTCIRGCHGWPQCGNLSTGAFNGVLHEPVSTKPAERPGHAVL